MWFVFCSIDKVICVSSKQSRDLTLKPLCADIC